VANVPASLSFLNASRRIIWKQNVTS
jgi:hypothetical protein